MTVYLADPDVTLHHGDVLETLRGMPDASVDCVVTSPPYWGLRDYGTGAWEGGDPACDHIAKRGIPAVQTGLGYPADGGPRRVAEGNTYNEGAFTEQFRDVCGKCGATRQDQQLGLEPTPDLFVARMVEVFREVRRVLVPHGTCWVNMGDGYNANQGAGFNGQKRQDHANRHTVMPRPPGLKPKDLVGMPWRLAFALQADGWYLRSDIVWSKPNPMPESVTDRPTKAHEYVFLLTKQPRYFFDQEAVREPALRAGDVPGGDNGRAVDAFGVKPHAPFNGTVPAGRNIRSVWEIATQPYPEAHFATYPEELVRRCLLAGCPEWVCRECGKPRERIVEREANGKPRGAHEAWNAGTGLPLHRGYRGTPTTTDYGFSDCGHNNYRPGIVLDPFIGSGTTAHVARKHGRHAIGIDLNADYLALAARRLQQQSLFAEGAA